MLPSLTELKQGKNGRKKDLQHGNERVQNTHRQGEWVKRTLLPSNVGKKSVNDSGPTVGS